MTIYKNVSINRTSKIMSEGRQRILSPLTGRKKQKARNNTREKILAGKSKAKFS